MEIKIKEFTGDANLMSHMILTSVNGAALKTVTDIDGRDGDTLVNVELKFNGVEIDIRKFISLLDESWDREVRKACRPEAKILFESMKHDFKSKNSTNAQLNKIKEQLQKANDHIKNISENVSLISSH